MYTAAGRFSLILPRSALSEIIFGSANFNRSEISNKSNQNLRQDQ